MTSDPSADAAQESSRRQGHAQPEACPEHHHQLVLHTPRRQHRFGTRQPRVPPETRPAASCPPGRRACPAPDRFASPAQHPPPRRPRGHGSRTWGPATVTASPPPHEGRPPSGRSGHEPNGSVTPGACAAAPRAVSACVDRSLRCSATIRLRRSCSRQTRRRLIASTSANPRRSDATSCSTSGSPSSAPRRRPPTARRGGPRPVGRQDCAVGGEHVTPAAVGVDLGHHRDHRADHVREWTVEIRTVGRGHGGRRRHREHHRVGGLAARDCSPRRPAPASAHPARPPGW